MYCSVNTAVLSGIECINVKCEADVSNGLPVFDIVGFLSTEVRESRERVRTALKNVGITLPPKRITINISPASIRKSGTAFDLPIACAILGAMEVFDTSLLEHISMVGELSLEGEVLPVKGVLPIALGTGIRNNQLLIIPEGNQKEADIIPKLNYIPVRSLTDVINFLTASVNDRDSFICHAHSSDIPSTTNYELDFSEIHGQFLAKRAAEIAAAGHHHLMMIGPPGAGKTMTAKCIPTIMPPMTFTEQLTISSIYSVAGMLNGATHLADARPFRNPHHSISNAGLIGGGMYPKPGEISLATSGILFLDELTEFHRDTLELLRQPLEDQRITISKAGGTLTYPADFLLVAAMNPCPCGFYPDLRRCRCTDRQIKNYLGKISQPLLDRIDLAVEVQELSFSDLKSKKKEETSEEIRERVIKAREIQKARFKGEYLYNSQMPGASIPLYCPLSDEGTKYMEGVYEKLGLSVRTYQKILKVARTIADLDNEPDILLCHLMEAVSYRRPDQKYWQPNQFMEEYSYGG